MTEEEFLPTKADEELERRIDRAMRDVEEELGQAMELFPAFSSAHEGYAIILEELDELWEDVKNKGGAGDWIHMKSEATQVAAMAIRFLVDLEGKYLDKR